MPAKHKREVQHMQPLDLEIRRAMRRSNAFRRTAESIAAARDAGCTDLDLVARLFGRQRLAKMLAEGASLGVAGHAALRARELAALVKLERRNGPLTRSALAKLIMFAVEGL